MKTDPYTEAQEKQEIAKNLERIHSNFSLIERLCTQNARSQRASSRELRAVREKAERHIARLERGEDENTQPIKIPPR